MKLMMTLAAATMAATPAMAQDRGAYVGLDVGYAFAPDLELATDATRDDPGYAFMTDGYDIAGTVGYDFGRFRLEGEIGYSDVGLDGSQAPQNDPVGMGTRWDAVGGVKTTRYMINALVDFGQPGRVNGFAGAGIGGADLDLYIRNEPFDIPIFDDKDGSFAWQLLAGVRVPVSSKLDAVAKYRFFNAPGAEWENFFGREEGDTYRTHTISAGVQLRF